MVRMPVQVTPTASFEDVFILKLSSGNNRFPHLAFWQLENCDEPRAQNPAGYIVVAFRTDSKHLLIVGSWTAKVKLSTFLIVRLKMIVFNRPIFHVFIILN